MKKITEVKSLGEYRLSLRFDDDVNGEIDLSHLAGRGVFSRWSDAAFFNRVRIGEFGELTWDGSVDLCPDALYSQITGCPPAAFLDVREPSIECLK